MQSLYNILNLVLRISESPYWLHQEKKGADRGMYLTGILWNELQERHLFQRYLFDKNILDFHIVGLWPLRSDSHRETDNTLVLSFVGQTRWENHNHL